MPACRNPALRYAGMCPLKANIKHMKPHRIAIFASGSGSNAEEIITYFQYHPGIEVKLLLSNNVHAQALQRAEKFKVKTKTFTKIQFQESREVLHWLKEEKITHLVLAGFMWLIPDYLTHTYSGKIINIHPALLPRFGGKGMYGMFVHEAVKAASEPETGIPFETSISAKPLIPIPPIPTKCTLPPLIISLSFRKGL